MEPWYLFNAGLKGLELKKNYVLIDYENVPVTSLALLKGEQFHVRVFLGPKNTKLPVELVLAMQAFGDRAQYIKLEAGGSNALDFHIAYYLGVLVTADPLGFYHIISKDTGFDPLINHLKAKNVRSARSASIEEMPCFVPGASNGNGTHEEAVNTKPQRTAAQTTVDELIQMTVGDLIKRKASKPRTPKTLLSTIRAKCGKAIPASDIEAVFDGLVKLGYVKVNGTQVSYTLPDR